ncbi:MAG: ribonuclease D [Azospirillaceae bacterium]
MTDTNTLIDRQEDLAAACARLARERYVAIDTEFMRESTYWPKLCLIQLAGAEEAVAIDPLAEGMDLAPLHDMMADDSVLKVFHSGRQDIEIFVHETGRVPHPVFDTQVAAMVCGFGESVGYEKLIARLVGAAIDKSSRFTDWSRRPLSDRQLSYALSDVIHLRPAYEKLAAMLHENGRESWLEEEMDVLTDPETYRTHPEDAWLRLKPRSTNGKYLAVLKELAAWRERTAQERDQPRNRILRDETMMDVAAHTPRTPEELAKARGIGRSVAEGWQGREIIRAVDRGLSMPKSERPSQEKRDVLPNGLGPTIELLKVLLKLRCEEHEVAQKLVASVADLERIAADDDAVVPALHGWRRQVFGEAALDLKHGRIALMLKRGRVVLVRQ